MSDTNNFRSNMNNITNDKKSKILLLGAGAVIIGGLVFAFAPGVGRGPASSIPSAPTSGGPPGGVPNNPEMEQALRTADTQRLRIAEKENGSALPSPVVRDLNNRSNSMYGNRDEKGSGEPPEPAEPPPPMAPPPVLALPSMEPPRPIDRTQQAQGPQQPIGPPPLDQGLIQAMQAQMRAMLNVPIRPSETVYLYRPQNATGQNGTGTNGVSTSASSGQAASAANGLQGGTRSAGAGGGTENAPATAQAAVTRPSRFSPPATGTILYSRLIGQVNSDVPGPVIAEITQGALSGSRLIGSFQFTEGGVIMQFSSMTVPFTDDGLERTEVVPINAVAVDATNLGTAMSTSIDRRVLERVAFGFATAFIQGLGQAITQSGSTTTLSAGGVSVGQRSLSVKEQLLAAGGSASGVAGKILDQTFGSRRTTIMVEADTPFGLLFLGNSGSGSTNAGQ